MKKALKLKIAFLILAAGAAYAQPTAGDRILGTWLTPNGESKIEVVKCGEAYCGSIKSMKTPHTDEHNPDASLRQRSLVGVQILSGFKYDGTDSWTGGTLYGPERGKNVSPTLTLSGPDTLDIKVNAGMVHKTINWTREK